jgi:hypothetical protein
MNATAPAKRPNQNALAGDDARSSLGNDAAEHRIPRTPTRLADGLGVEVSVRQSVPDLPQNAWVPRSARWRDADSAYVVQLPTSFSIEWRCRSIGSLPRRSNDRQKMRTEFLKNLVP